MMHVRSGNGSVVPDMRAVRFMSSSASVMTSFKSWAGRFVPMADCTAVDVGDGGP